MFHSMNALFHRNHWLNFIPMVAVVSSKPPREGAVGSYVSSVIRFTLFRLPWGIRVEMRSLQLLTLCICIFMDPDQSEIGEFEFGQSWNFVWPG